MNTTTPRAHAHPAIFLFLVVPFGVVGGYVTVTLAYLFSKAGISVDAVAALIGASLLPSVFRFMWAPLVDTTLTLKKWYILSIAVSAAALLATGIYPIRESSLPILTIIVVVANVAVSFSSIATNGLAALDTPEERKGIVGGYLQAGNLGGAGVGGGAGLWLAENMSNAWLPAGVLAVSCLLCCIALFFVKEPVSTVQAESAIKTLKNLFTDLWDTLKTRLGILAMVLCFLPLGTGAASNLWAAVAGDWHAGANTVAFVTGILSGVITAAGCLLGGWLCDRMNKQSAYLIFGLIQAACAVAMAYAPHTEWMYIIWTSLYAFSLGMSYAGYGAFVLEAIGRGAAATKFTVYASLSNIPIYYMTLVDGWGYKVYGPKGLLNIEAAMAVAGILIFGAIMIFWKERKVPNSI